MDSSGLVFENELVCVCVSRVKSAVKMGETAWPSVQWNLAATLTSL